MKEKDIINFLIRERQKRNLTQKDIAKRSGLTQQAISALENQTRTPNLSTLLKYTKALKIKGKIFLGDDNMNTKLIKIAKKNDKAAEIILDLLNNVDEYIAKKNEKTLAKVFGKKTDNTTVISLEKIKEEIEYINDNYEIIFVGDLNNDSEVEDFILKISQDTFKNRR
ncbi:helix-turn-helix domain-containing protein [Faecalibacillus faecis]|uniref:helix-turn-helix domain-containing protein n=1 Tax=Faecalibacillus faecis TaxID=1982628 RepID=UPI0038681E3C